MDCVICQLAFGPEEMNGVRELKTFNGYTVDLRLRQFRKIALTPTNYGGDCQEGKKRG